MGYPPTPHVILTVSALTAVLRSHVESAFADIWVEGEVSNLRMPSSGHAYFTLKDATSQMRAVMFRSVGRFLRFHLKDGMCVICRGRLTVYEPKGDYQMLVDYAEPKGVGALQVAFEQLKERLAAEGLFEAARKRRLPVFPRRLGIITSPTGAALRDIIQVAHRRRAAIELLLDPLGVPGVWGNVGACRTRVETERRALLDPAALVQRAMQRRDELEMRLFRATTSRMREAIRAMDSLRQGLLLRSPMRRIEKGLAMLPQLRRRLEQRVVGTLTTWRHSLQHGAGAL